MNVWFTRTDKPEECFECHERLEPGDIVCKMMTRNSAPSFGYELRYKAFHPACFPTWALRLFEEDLVRKNPVRRALLMKMSRTHAQYYKAIDSLPLSDWNKIYLYRLRKRARRIYKQILDEGGGIVFQARGSRWQMRGALWESQ